MIKRINKHNSVIAQLFLLGYVSFVLISVAHNHIEMLIGSGKHSVLVIVDETAGPGYKSEQNCQICHLSSSINTIASPLALHSILLIEGTVIIKYESTYQSNTINVNFLRGPPSFTV
jgi:hypothetical protein